MGFLVRWSGADDVSGVAAFDVQVRALPEGGWSDWQREATGLAAGFVPPGPGGYVSLRAGVGRASAALAGRR